MATGTVQERLREESDWIAGMENPWIRFTGGVPTWPLPRRVSDLRTLSQILKKVHARNFNGTGNKEVLAPVLAFRGEAKTRTYFGGAKMALPVLPFSQGPAKI